MNPASEALYQRLLRFATDCLSLVRSLPRNDFNQVYGRQLIRSASSPGANYIEAIEAESTKDFKHKLRICKKEIKESNHWANLIKHANEDSQIRIKANNILKETDELVRIFSASIRTIESKNPRNGK